jgi:Cu2+-exporting ATPase
MRRTESMAVARPAAPRARERVRCDHCGLPVPRGLYEDGAERQFCCHACRTAWDVIHACGLDAYYAVLADVDAEPAPARTTGRGHEELDDEAFQSRRVRTLPGGARRVRLLLENLHCAACVWLLERLPAVVDGVVEARVDYPRRAIDVTWDPRRVALSRIAGLIDRMGYPCHPYRESEADAAWRREDRRMIVRVGVAGALAGNIMLIALALYAGADGAMGGEFRTLFRWMSAGLGWLALLWPGSVFLRGAWASLRMRTLHMDVPVAIALVTGGAWGLWNTVRGTGEIYFDTLATLVFLLLVGRWMQMRQQRRATEALALLDAITPTSATVVEPDGSRRVAAMESLAPGMIVEVAAGESVPVDGEVVGGEVEVDESLLTGESRPVARAEGDPLVAGAVVRSAPVLVRVTAVGEDTRAGRMMRLVEEAALARAPVVRLADKISGWFVAVVLTLAALTVIAWAFIEPSMAVEHATALLIVTCPCALGLATPLAITAAIGRAAGRQILVKGGAALEALAHPGRLVLDKTGTLTTGRPTVAWRELAADDAHAAAALEALSAHPVADAIARDLGPGDDAPTPIVEGFRHTLGGGVEGSVDGRAYAVGSARFVEGVVGALGPRVGALVGRAAGDGHTPVVVARDGDAVGVVAVGDTLRADAHEAITSMRAMGWDVSILSGDHPAIVERVARALGVEAEGGATPERKLEAVRRLAGEGPVVMVGDGVNDAAALAAATVGVAVHGGAEASLAAADAYVGRPDLGGLVELLAGARRTRGVVKRGLVISLAYNALFASLAIAGLITPLAAAVLMPASSLTVIGLAYRSRTFGDT